MEATNPNFASGPAQFRVTPDMLHSVECENCNNTTFQQVLFIKRLSALQSPDGEEKYVPFPTYQCAKCGHINEAFSDVE